MPISFSAIMGGPELENTPIDHILHSLGEDVEKISIPEGDAELIIWLHVPGKLEKPDFRGVRIGKFSRKENTLQLKVAVPQQILASPNIFQELGSLLKVAVREGKKYLQRKGVSFSQDAHLLLIDRIIAAVEKHRHLWPERKKLRNQAWQESLNRK